MTWNLWWRFGPWRERQAAIRAEIAAQSPDLLLAQEVWCHSEDGDQAAQLAEPAGYHVARSTRPDGQPYAFGNAILSRWPLGSIETIALPGTDGLPSHRTAVLAEVDHPGGSLLAVVTHLEWRYDHSALRVRQLEALMAELRLRRLGTDSERAIVLGGDLNAVPDADEVRRLTGLSAAYGEAGSRGPVFTDAWTAVRDDPGYTWTRDNPHTRDALWPRRRLDYVMVSWPRPKPIDNPLAAHLGGQEPVEGVVPSDHYAVVVDLDDRPPEEHE